MVSVGWFVDTLEISSAEHPVVAPAFPSLELQFLPRLPSSAPRGERRGAQTS